MSLPNLGAVLTFAEELEQQAVDFYTAWNYGPAAELAKESQKNIKTIKRLLRENVTEMILEPIVDFARAPYETATCDPKDFDLAQAKDASKGMETKIQEFYQTAMQKLEALPEVARALKRFAKKRTARIEKIESCQ